MSIQGLKLQMNSEELSTTLSARIEYHGKRVEWLAKKIAELEPDVEQFKNDAVNQGKFSNSRVGSAVDNLSQQRDHHQDRVTLFKFMVAHVIPNETFILDENDLRKLEVIGQHGY